MRTTKILAAAFALAAGSGIAAAQDVITLGSAISITGKYSQEGKNAKDGYDFAVKKINDAGGIKVGGKTYRLEVKYYDDESTPARTAQPCSWLKTEDSVCGVISRRRERPRFAKTSTSGRPRRRSATMTSSRSGAVCVMLVKPGVVKPALRPERPRRPPGAGAGRLPRPASSAPPWRTSPRRPDARRS